jgi:hypothetical protein
MSKSKKQNKKFAKKVDATTDEFISLVASCKFLSKSERKKYIREALNLTDFLNLYASEVDKKGQLQNPSLRLMLLFEALRKH